MIGLVAVCARRLADAALADVLPRHAGLHFTWMVNSHPTCGAPAASKPVTIRGIAGGSRWSHFGEGWHNNHHAHPVSARHGLAWYELDITWLHINFLKKLGLAQERQSG